MVDYKELDKIKAILRYENKFLFNNVTEKGILIKKDAYHFRDEEHETYLDVLYCTEDKTIYYCYNPDFFENIKNEKDIEEKEVLLERMYKNGWVVFTGFNKEEFIYFKDYFDLCDDDDDEEEEWRMD